jgi:NAD(P)-dependent dehydrogenase (short-subunit alcohol dehydrogenase family)
MWGRLCTECVSQRRDAHGLADASRPADVRLEYVQRAGAEEGQRAVPGGHRVERERDGQPGGEEGVVVYVLRWHRHLEEADPSLKALAKSQRLPDVVGAGRVGKDATGFAVGRAALPLLPTGGAVVAVSSVNAFLAAPGVPAYAAAKAGLEGLVRQLALEYGPRGIRVNAVAPGMIGGDSIADAAAGYPLGRTGTPDEVAEAVLFLAGAGFVTGAVLPVDGGLSIASPAAFLRADLLKRWATGDRRP